MCKNLPENEFVVDKTNEMVAQSGSGHIWTHEQIERLDQSIKEVKERRLKTIDKPLNS